MAIAVEPTHGLVEAEQSIELLDLKSIKSATDNPRKELGDVAELAQSMQELGLLQPLVVTPRDGMFMVVCGHRRYAAAKHAGLTAVPAIVRELTEPQRIKAMLIENCQRTDLTALEEARAYNGLVDLDMSQREIARDVGKSQPHISKRLALLELPGNVLKTVDSGGITIGDALELLKLKDHPERLGAAFSRRGQHHQGIAGTVDQQLDELKREKKIATAEAKLAKDGVPILKYVRDGSYYFKPPKGAIELRKGASYGSVLPIDPKAHAKEPCHAAAIEPRGGDVVYFCTNRKNHPDVKTAEESWNRRSRRDNTKAKAHEKAMREARTGRRPFIGELVQRRLPKDDVVKTIVGGFIARGEAEAKKVACQILGLEQRAASRRGGVTTWHGVLEAFAAEGPANLLKAGLTLAIATEEIRLNSAWTIWDERQKEYFALLVQHGYETTAAEKLELAGKRPR